MSHGTLPEEPFLGRTADILPRVKNGEKVFGGIGEAS